MAWINAIDMEHLPVKWYDSEGEEILRAIAGCDPITGEVESFVLNQLGEFTIDNPRGEFCRRREFLRAPLACVPYDAKDGDKDWRLKTWDVAGR